MNTNNASDLRDAQRERAAARENLLRAAAVGKVRTFLQREGFDRQDGTVLLTQAVIRNAIEAAFVHGMEAGRKLQAEGY